MGRLPSSQCGECMCSHKRLVAVTLLLLKLNYAILLNTNP